MPRSFAPHVLMSQAAQFVMNQRHQLFQRSLIPFPPFFQERRDLVRLRFH
jgi:hypothetical protein